MNRDASIWTDNDKAFLKENYPTKGLDFCFQYLKKGKKAISAMVFRLKLKLNLEIRHRRPFNLKLDEEYCNICQQILPIANFNRIQYGKKGQKLANRCKKCLSHRALKSYHKYKTINGDTKLKKKYQNPEKWIHQVTKSRAKKNNIPFNLEISDIIIPKSCPVLDIPIIPFNNGPNSPSIDRFIPELGYVKGNVEIISWRANTLKNNATIKEIEMILNWMKSKKP